MRWPFFLFLAGLGQLGDTAECGLYGRDVFFDDRLEGRLFRCVERAFERGEVGFECYARCVVV